MVKNSLIISFLLIMMVSCSVPRVYFVDSSGIVEWNGRERTLQILWEHKQAGVSHPDTIVVPSSIQQADSFK